MPEGYSAQDAAEMLGMSVSQVRAFVRDGVLHPARDDRGDPRFSFQDLVLLRTAAGLVTERIPPRRVRRALLKLRERLPKARPLTGVQIETDGDRIVVQDGGARWQADSGQVLLDFTPAADRASSVAALARAAPAPPQEPAPPTGDDDADVLYALACDLEECSPDQARELYTRVVNLVPEHADAHVNLGRLLHESGAPGDAEAHYRMALAARPGDVTAAFNLGVALEDLGRADEAMTTYQAVIARDPRNADAHFNLARLHERAGHHEAAIRHLRTYRELSR